MMSPFGEFQVEFQVEIEIKSCPVDQKDNQQIFHISPIGLSESVVVNLESICSCDCEKASRVNIEKFFPNS